MKVWAISIIGILLYAAIAWALIIAAVRRLCP
jgi:hypothetical protein